MRNKDALVSLLKGETISFGRVKQVLNDMVILEDKKGHEEKMRVENARQYEVGQVLTYIRRRGQKIYVLGSSNKKGYFKSVYTFRIL